MKYTILSSLSFSTPSQQDTLHQAILANIAGKPVWGEVRVTKGIGQDGKPNTGVEVRFNNRVDMDNLFSMIKDRMAVIPVLKGKVSKHECYHDGLQALAHCVPEEEYIK